MPRGDAGSAEGVAHAREVLALRRQEWKDRGPDLQVKDMKHVKTKAVIEFSIKHLCEGRPWEELRYRLGLGPAYLDERWKWLRQNLVKSALPENEEEALQARYSNGTFLIAKLEKLVEELEERVTTVSEKNEHHYYKTKLDALKLLIEENRNHFDQYMEIKKLKEKEKHNRGVSIIFQNNFHVPRPGDNARDVKQVVEVLSEGEKLLQEMK